MALEGQERPVQTGELEQIKRLVELQSQIVELARKNEMAEKNCKALWLELERNARCFPRNGAPRLGLAFRLGRLRQRLLAALRSRTEATRTRTLLRPSLK